MINLKTTAPPKSKPHSPYQTVKANIKQLNSRFTTYIMKFKG